MTDSASVKRCACPEHEGPNPLPVSEFSKDRSASDDLTSRCKTCRNRATIRWRQANPEKVRERDRRRQQELRDAVFGHYGRVCACPGCSATENLEIDHVNGGGNAHRTELFGRPNASHEFYAWLIANNFPEGFQPLCRPCNRSKRETAACRLDHTA